ncbi:Sugar efflux transporter C [Vibrio stylophorae]|uniref:Sugar efflux transporter C n=1 Tax=Vibrio stylophorae TaxID=659351 RepID=A0ABN8DTT3_9VIBR|nr:sugar efflux transporter [Vibrio stylophorae]CAH0533689.1 Sugar efflux transporter C [Vibrio stylophorae]
MHFISKAAAFILTCFFTGLGGAFFYPLSTLYMVKVLGASPMQLTLFLVSTIITGMLISQRLARYSDYAGWPRKKIVMISLACYSVTVFVCAFNTNYWLALAVAIVINGFSAAAFPQIFALAREYGDKHFSSRSTLFMSTARASIALAWVCGPPLAFSMQSAFGFRYTFLAAAAITCITITVVWLFLPNNICQTVEVPTDEDKTEQEPDRPWYLQFQIMSFLLATTLMFFANNLYVNGLALYLTEVRQIDSAWTGYLMGVAAAIEIPIMLTVGMLAIRLGNRPIIQFGLMCGALFYYVMQQRLEPEQMVQIQLLNGIFVGIIATLAMVEMQNMMRKYMGIGTTLFNNAMLCSNLLTSFSLGIVGRYFGYQAIFIIGMYACFAAMLCLMLPKIRQYIQANKQQTA